LKQTIYQRVPLAEHSIFGSQTFNLWRHSFSRWVARSDRASGFLGFLGFLASGFQLPPLGQ